ncbi:hypothetical protein KBJ94_29150 [Pseudomonas sp. ITA]|uniref:C80 family cysteine peptidase n=1 Tax=Pseudomonas sp. ITA TaxID=2825841 RepID=UPI0024965905|nr:C80 family cysteine peptidase [Pseudomonas sp. ITA]MDI2146118.1 hypothetical protein [Pseudomonas sp. ITA]
MKTEVTDKYDGRAVYRVETDPTTSKATQRINDKHVENSVLLQRDAQGRPTVVAGDLKSLKGNVKVELVGHTGKALDGTQTLGGLKAHELAQEVVKLPEIAGVPIKVKKVTVVGCGSGNCADGPSLADQVGESLKTQGIEAPTKGYEGSIALDASGHKRSLSQDSPDALGKKKGSYDLVTPKNSHDTEPVMLKSMNQVDENGKYKIGINVLEQQRMAKEFEHEAPIKSLPKETGQFERMQADYSGKGVTHEEINSVKYYTQEGYTYINEALKSQRDGGVTPHDFMAEHLNNTESFINKVANESAGPLYRILKAGEPVADLFSRVKPGATIMSKGFVSTSTSPGFIKNFRGAPSSTNELIYYRLDGVQSGAHLGGIRQDQGEVLVQRNTPFVVNSVIPVYNGHALFISASEGKHSPGTDVWDMKSWEKLPPRGKD